MKTSAKIPATPASRRRGFGLVELLIVMTIIGLITALAVPMIGLAKDSAGSQRSKRNAQQLASLAATAIAGGDNAIPAAGSAQKAIRLLVDGLAVTGVMEGTVLQLKLSPEETEAASKFLDYADGVLFFVDRAPDDID